MKRIDIELFQYENLVFGKVLHVDKELISSSSTKLLAEKDGFAIKSCSYPQINSKTLFVWGDEPDKNNMVICKEFHTTMDANDWIKSAKELLDKINNVIKVESTKIERVI